MVAVANLGKKPSLAGALYDVTKGPLIFPFPDPCVCVSAPLMKVGASKLTEELIPLISGESNDKHVNVNFAHYGTFKPRPPASPNWGTGEHSYNTAQRTNQLGPAPALLCPGPAPNPARRRRRSHTRNPVFTSRRASLRQATQYADKQARVSPVGRLVRTKKHESGGRDQALFHRLDWQGRK